MQGLLSQLQRSSSVKVLTIGFLILVLLIPLQMIKGTIDERSSLNLQAKSDIYRTWGGWQLVAGPILVLPYDIVHDNKQGERYVERTAMYVLPSDLAIDTVLTSEIRYRGIHKVPVYSAKMNLSGEFAALDEERLGLAGKTVHWRDAYIAIGISDGRGIADTPVLQFAGRKLPFEPGGQGSLPVYHLRFTHLSTWQLPMNCGKRKFLL